MGGPGSGHTALGRRVDGTADSGFRAGGAGRGRAFQLFGPTVPVSGGDAVFSGNTGMSESDPAGVYI